MPVFSPYGRACLLRRWEGHKGTFIVTIIELKVPQEKIIENLLQKFYRCWAEGNIRFVSIIEQSRDSFEQFLKVWFVHAFLWLKSRNNTSAARGNTITSKITNWFHVNENIKTSEISCFAAYNSCSNITCWITNGWRKTSWVKFSASPAASTNQNLIEDVSHVVKK